MKAKLIYIGKKVALIGGIFIASMIISNTLMVNSIIKNIKVVNVEEVQNNRGYVSLEIYNQVWIFGYKTK